MKSIRILTIGSAVQAVCASSPSRLFAADKHRTGWGTRINMSTQQQRQSRTSLILFPRGGDADSAVLAEDENVATQELPALDDESLDDRVSAAMKRLGLEVEEEEGLSAETSTASVDSGNCEGGVCAMPDANTESTTETEITTEEAVTQQDIDKIAESISAEMSVPKDIVFAAIYSTFDNNKVNEEAARSMVEAEVSAIANVAEDSAEVQQLVSEGFDSFFARRSLAFVGMDIDNARAILIADAEDEEAEVEAQKQAAAAEAAAAEAEAAVKEEPKMKTVTVDYPTNFDPVAPAPKPQEQKPPPPAKKEDVVFECTVEDIQKLVIESPVPVLLDVYADWCGPCKQLTPALEEIVVKAGGALRLCKVNTDQQRQISGALEVKALPTIFGVKDGKILNMFQGMPRDEEMLRNFLMGLLIPGQPFKPAVTAEEKANYNQLSTKLLKVAAASSFSFSARERLQGRVAKLLDELVADIGGDTGMAVADDSARVLRSLMSNVIKDPFQEKFRKVNLANKVVAEKVTKYPSCISILKSVGFAPDGESTLVVGKGKRVVNIAPINVARDCIDKWVDQNRYNIAASARKRKDEIERARLAAEAEEAEKNQVDEEEDESEEEEVDPNLCIIKYRIEGKKKLNDVEMDADDTLTTLMGKLELDDGESVQFTCAAKRLIVKSSDEEKMSKTLKELRLMPSASIVIKIGEGKSTGVTKGSLAERNSANKKKTGSHSMHSIGLYSQNDGNKAETFESGGVLYDHDISDDEEEEDDKTEEASDDVTEEQSDDENSSEGVDEDDE